MPQDLILPDPSGAEFATAVRALRDHLLGAVDVDREIVLDGRPYVVAWANRHVAADEPPYFDLTSAMRVVHDRRDHAPAVVSTGEEQITLVIDGERFIFHLVEARPDRDRLPPA
jgi:hypothetical protein